MNNIGNNNGNDDVENAVMVPGMDGNGEDNPPKLKVRAKYIPQITTLELEIQ